MSKRNLARHHFRRAAALVIGAGLLVSSQFGWLKQPAKVAEKTQPGLYHVVEFVDGDTISVDMNGTKETLRFIGVDTPELHDPRKAVQCFAKDAAAFTKGLIGGNNVRLEADPLDTNRDRYNRLLRYIYLPDGTLVNSEIISHGYGFAYLSFPFMKSDEFRTLQKTAREQNLGLWSKCTPSENKFGGYTSNDAKY